MVVGSMPVSIGPKMAASTKASTITRPMRNERCRASLRSTRNRRRGASAWVGARASAASVIADARVDHGVEDVDGDVDHDEAEAEQQHGALDQRIVPRDDALHDQAADAGERK